MGWNQGEHVAVVGDAGSGKTFLLSKLLEPGLYRSHVIIFRTKSDDIRFPGYVRIRSVREISVSRQYYLLDPAPRADRSAVAKRRAAIEEAFDFIFRSGGWSAVIDELFYVQDRLGLGDYVDEAFTQGRSQYITVVAGMQRPVAITRFALSQSTHLFAFETEGRDAKTLGEVTGVRTIPKLVEELDRFEFLYFNRRSKSMQIDKAQNIQEVLG